MRARRTLLLVHPDGLRLEELSRALGTEFDVAVASTLARTSLVLSTRTIDLVAADASMGVDFLDELEARAPGVPRAILFEGEASDEWVEAMRDGHVFFALPEGSAGNVAPQLRALTYPRATERLRACGECSVRIVRDGDATVLSRPVLDVSNQGLAFQLDDSDPLDQFLPGRRVAQLSVWRGEERVLDAAGSIVRHVGTCDGASGYRVGMEFATQPLAPAACGEIVKDPVQRSALLREALRSGSLRVHRADDDGPLRAVVRGRIDTSGGVMLLEGEFPRDWNPGDVIRATFEADATSYSFLASVAARQRFTTVPADAAARVLVLLVPRMIRGMRRRQTNRYRPALNAPITVELAPFLGQERIRKPVLDINTSGLAFHASYRHDAFPVGMMIPHLRVHLPKRAPLTLRGRVVSQAAVPGSSSEFKCGVRFEGASAMEEAQLANAILDSGFPGVEDAQGLSFETLWAFLRESGFLYPEKEEKLRPVMPDIERTLTTVIARPNPLFKTLLYRRDEQLTGHLSTLLAYRNTWVVQHLAVSRSGPGKLAAARLLNLGIAEYSEQIPRMEWLKIYFRPNNRWPARVFGRFARLNFDHRFCDIRTFAYLVAPSDGADRSPPTAAHVRVTPASPQDHARLEEWLVASGRSLEVAAEDLCRDQLSLPAVAAEYEALGLERRREMLAAYVGNRLRGFALLEISSHGLNFSELTNAFRVYLLEEDPAVQAALAAAARRRYAELGRPLAIALSDAASNAGFEAAGFSKAKEYCCWTLHRSLYRRYADYMHRVYDRVQARRLAAEPLAIEVAV